MNGKGWWFGVSMLAAMLGCDSPSPSAGVNSGGTNGQSALKVLLPIVAGICTFGTGCDTGILDPGSQHGFVVAPGWSVPECDGIDGAPGLSMTLDFGESFVPTLDGIEQPETKDQWVDLFPFTRGLVALHDRPNTLFAIQYNSVVMSHDGGCHWNYHPESLNGTNFWLGQTNGVKIPMHDAGDGVVYAHGVHNQLVRITEDTIDVSELYVGQDVSGKSGNAGWQDFRGMTSLKGHPDSLRAFTHAGFVLESDDGGVTWGDPVGAIAAPEEYQYLSPSAVAHFDPSNWDRILVHFGGTVRISEDGGQLWEVATFETSSEGPLLLQSVVPSPTDFDVVWAMALQMEPGKPIAEQIRLFRSMDAGKNFSVVGDGTDFPLSMGGSLRPVPQRAAEVLIIQETEILRVNAPMQSASVHPLEAPVVVTAFSPADNQVLYLGLNAGQYWAENQ